jgi:hypothetical protein
MSKYAYQIKGALEDAHGKLRGFQVLVCDLFYFESVMVPIEIIDIETAKYLEFRLNVTTAALDIQRLPIEIQNRIRAPLGRWLDRWVLENFHGDPSKPKSTNS